MALGMAASLTLGTGAAVLAAPPGSPFYNARLVIETALMPSVKDIDARLAAYEDHFEARLAEAEAALARGDADAAAAALVAYQEELDKAVGDVADGDARLEHLEAVIAKHIAKLNELAERLPTEVARQNAVEHAIAASERAVEKIKEKKAKGKPADPGSGNPGSNPDPGNGNGNGTQGGNTNAGGNGNQGGNPNAGGHGNQAGPPPQGD
jgi:hypothetical protein